MDLPPPLNGDVSLSGTLERDTAVYSCNEGYTLEVGDTIRMCTSDGEWSGTEPVCQSKLAKQ